MTEEIKIGSSYADAIIDDINSIMVKMGLTTLNKKDKIAYLIGERLNEELEKDIRKIINTNVKRNTLERIAKEIQNAIEKEIKLNMDKSIQLYFSLKNSINVNKKWLEAKVVA